MDKSEPGHLIFYGFSFATTLSSPSLPQIDAMMTAMEQNAEMLNKKLKSELIKLREEREEAERNRRASQSSGQANPQNGDTSANKPAEQS
jgi:hypothetical protein